jgi:hypothetical protein
MTQAGRSFAEQAPRLQHADADRNDAPYFVHQRRRVHPTR